MSAESDAEEDPVGYFLDDMAYHGRSERTRDAYERVLREFEDFLHDRGDRPATARHRECLAYVHRLRNRDVAPSTVATYASYLHRFYAYMSQVGVFDDNPMALVMEELDESVERDPTRREVSVAAMRSFVAGIAHPLDTAVIVTLLKTGMRAGELSNLDLRDLHLPGLDAGKTRAPLQGRGAALYVSPEPTVGAETNGEVRDAANKRKRETVVPVDGELADVLRRWLAVRPDPRSPADPLFASTREWGKRLTPDAVGYLVREHAAAADWHRAGADASENVTPHYFRHFFTTHLRDRTGNRGVVKYLRGDVADDVIETYTHNWGDRVREVYEANVYRLLDRSRADG
jgi:site-specific recombinase XerD